MHKVLRQLPLRRPLLIKIFVARWGASAAAFLVYLVAAGAASSPSHSLQNPPAPADSLTATVAAVDTQARTLEVITGVGHALAAVRLEIPPACRIMVGGARRQLADLRPGDIVRIQYRKLGERDVAENIETVELPPRVEDR